MRSKLAGSIILVFGSAAFFLSGCKGGREESLQLPSEVEPQIIDSVMAVFDRGEIREISQLGEVRKKITEGMIGSVKSKGLAREEMLTYGKLLGWAELWDEERAVYEELRGGDDVPGRKAWVNLINMKVKDEDYERAEEMISEYRSACVPVPGELGYLSTPVFNLARRYSEMNKPEAAIRVYMDELRSLPFDAPYHSFGVADGLTSLLIEMGRIDECRGIIESFGANLKGGLDRYIAGAAYDDTTKQEDDPVVQQYEDQIYTYELLLKRVDLIGKKAPPFVFLHVYNADSTFTLEDFLGKVVVLDFWATWCLPCIEGYEELRRIYADFHDRGLEVVGVTSFQGIYRDLDTGEVEGSGDESLSRQREIELTRSFINKHRMFWPCAFSDRPVFDPEYTVRSVPTYVILGRKGNVRFIHAGIRAEQQIRRIIAELI